MVLFDINMPMLYGEGHRAFQRLQEQILKRSEDYSLFAWVYEEIFKSYEDYSLFARVYKDKDFYSIRRSFLATAPSAFNEDYLKGFRFEDLANLAGRQFGKTENVTVRPLPSITSRGLSVTLPLLVRRRYTDHSYWAAICSVTGEPLRLFCVPVEQIDANSRIYIRRPAYSLGYLLPYTHDDESKLSFEAFPLVSRADLSKFVYTDMNVAISDMLRSADSTSFHLEVAPPSEIEATLRFCSVKLMKIMDAGLVKEFHPCLTYKHPYDLLFFRYTNENSNTVNAGLAISLRNGAP